MNFDAFWQTHRKFITGIAIGLAVFLLGLVFIQKTVGSKRDSALKRTRTARSSLSRTPRYDAAAVRDLGKRLEALEQKSGQLVGKTLPQQRHRYKAPAGQSARQHYIQLTGDIRQELIPWALRQNVDVDESLGLPPTSPSQPQVIERVLRGLDLVETVVRLAVLSGAKEIEDISISTRPPKRAKGMAASVLDLTPVQLDVVLPDEELNRFIRNLFTHPPLGIESVSLGPLDTRRNERRVTVRMTAGQIPVLEEEEV